jgi:uncharacterized protein YaeQ
MSFIDAFFSFNIQISNSHSNVFENLRIKVPKHELDTWADFFARLCGYCHAFSPGLKLLPGRSNYEYDFRRLNSVDEELAVGFIGKTQKKILLRLLKQNPSPHVSIYLYTREQLSLFCHELRGSKSNWIDPINFFLFEQEALEALSEVIEAKNELSVTIVEPDCLYISLNQQTYTVAVTPLVMWEQYQRSIGNIADVVEL